MTLLLLLLFSILATILKSSEVSSGFGWNVSSYILDWE
jgi:hypothetical protein